MRVHFIGTGGGRFTMIRQLRRTGGFIVEYDDTTLYVDPAPGALVHALEDGHSLSSLDGIFASHGHLDHCGDLDVMIEAMTEGCTREQGTLIANTSVLHGSGDLAPGTDAYHRDAPATVIEAEEGGSHQLGAMDLTFTETRHKGVQTTGFLLEADGTTLGYVPDTELFDGLVAQYEKADHLIVNVLRPHDKEYRGHLNLEEAFEIVEDVDPETAIVQHFGMNFLQSFRDQLGWLEENAADQDVILASDGKTYTLDGDEGLQKFVD